MIGRVDELDPRAWLAWGIAAATPPLLGRNPFPVAMVFLVALAVLSVSRRPETASPGWGLILRLAVVVAAVGVVFNVRTVRAGDLVIGTVPDSVPLLDGELTWNAALYGVLSGFGLVTLVLVGSVVGGALNWVGVVRLLPDRFLGMAVAGSIAFNLVPQTAVAFQEIREAQRARGHRVRSARDLVPLIVPLLNGGIDRAMGMAEVLESRGFGAATRTGGRWDVWLGGTLVAATGVFAFAAAVGRLWIAAASGLLGAGIGLMLARRPATVDGGRTRYREVHLRTADRVVIAASVCAASLAIVGERRWPGALTYEPYPSLDAPEVSLPVLCGLLLLFAPALVLTGPGQTPA